MNTIILASLLSILGVAIGAFIPSLFALLSKKEEHKTFIKEFRAKRAFRTCEKIISHIFFAELGSTETIGSVTIFSNHLLRRPEELKNWLALYVNLWTSKRYLLDKKSFQACRELHEYLYELTSKNPAILLPDSINAFPHEQFLRWTKEFQALLRAAHESLEEFLRRGIEDA